MARVIFARFHGSNLYGQQPYFHSGQSFPVSLQDKPEQIVPLHAYAKHDIRQSAIRDKYSGVVRSKKIECFRFTVLHTRRHLSVCLSALTQRCCY